MSLQSVLEKAKKTPRTPQDAGDGEAPQAAPKEPRVRKAKGPKMVQATNEDGSLKFEEDGTTPVMVEAPKAAKKERAPRVDADGNPLPRRANVFLDSQVIHRTELGKTVKYREGSDRQNMFDLMQDGITVGEFYAAAGGKAASHRFLVHQVNVLLGVTVD
jgi:hypothetical protein